ncbi:hypothetical protein HF1_13270 [Mycoplasma haemofelis str. Langford 1]|uniref:Uncharacterized protein n=1 Tax=Mycoplasma haemofelis (strain Langford 1) TaxID=941640 RepID=E8ZJL4_MYCHL|nr:hypothetical protein HF1_13270 [Mycoplasma haemofelis str. Langford 1]
MDGITINSASGQDDANISAIKTGCKTRRDKLHYELDFEKTLEEVKKWCTKDSR